MKKVLMVVLLGVFSVLFANEADNASAKKKYYKINGDRYKKFYNPFALNILWGAMQHWTKQKR